jgi:hypothetical protein
MALSPSTSGTVTDQVPSGARTTATPFTDKDVASAEAVPLTGMLLAAKALLGRRDDG